MAVASIDYENVDVSLLQALQTIKMMEQFITTTGVTSVPGTAVFITALDEYRNAVAMEIEKQGKR